MGVPQRAEERAALDTLLWETLPGTRQLGQVAIDSAQILARTRKMYVDRINENENNSHGVGLKARTLTVCTICSGTPGSGSLDWYGDKYYSAREATDHKAPQWAISSAPRRFLVQQSAERPRVEPCQERSGVPLQSTTGFGVRGK